MEILYNDSLIAARIKSELDKIKSGGSTKTDFTISTDDWNLTEGKYSAIISASVTADNYVEVFFDDSCSEIVSAANISTEGETFQGGISITAENLPTDSIQGSYYVFKGDSFTMKARVNVESGVTNFVGATSITSGSAGLVPAPLAGDQDKFLRGNGQWATISSSGGGAFTVNGAVAKAMSVTGAATVDMQSETAIVSITGGSASDFILNGSTIKSASITGANVNIDSLGAANITIPSAKINNVETNAVTITGGANITTDTDTKVTKIIVASRESLQSANFQLSESAVTLNAYQPVTIQASRQGDGLISCYSERFAQVEQLNATEFRVSPKYAGSGDVGFWLAETEEFYGASKNVNIVCPDDSANAILMHFDDADEPFLNSGNGECVVEKFIDSGTASIVSGGKFDSALTSRGYKVSAVIGGADFTLHYWTKDTQDFPSNLKASNLKAGLTSYLGCFNLNTTSAYFAAPIADRTAVFDDKATLNYPLLDWTHIAYCYDHTAGELKFFAGGALTKTWQVSYEKMLTDLSLYPTIDEMQLLDGVCLWKENFTPPTEPC